MVCSMEVFHSTLKGRKRRQSEGRASLFRERREGGGERTRRGEFRVENPSSLTWKRRLHAIKGLKNRLIRKRGGMTTDGWASRITVSSYLRGEGRNSEGKGISHSRSSVHKSTFSKTTSQRLRRRVD